MNVQEEGVESKKIQRVACTPLKNKSHSGVTEKPSQDTPKRKRQSEKSLAIISSFCYPIQTSAMQFFKLFFSEH
ncbi:hypothetical protein ACRRTK_020091 [Alexandromys fortis]